MRRLDMSARGAGLIALGWLDVLLFPMTGPAAVNTA
jgi:hypothetical protein